MSLAVECPSGLAVSLREFKVSDEDLLANPRSQRKGEAVTDLLTAITESVDDPGPYTLREPNKKNEAPWLAWSDVLQGDRMTVLLKNRIYTWGDELTFKQPCPNCRQKVETDIDLQEMPIKVLPDGSRTHAQSPAQNHLYCVLPRCKTRVGFRLLRGSDDRSLAKIQKNQKASLSSGYLRLRVTAIQDVPEARWKAWLTDLGADDAAFLRAAFDDRDCGVDQEVEFECNNCDHTWTDDVRFRSDFLFPKYRGTTQIKT